MLVKVILSVVIVAVVALYQLVTAQQGIACANVPAGNFVRNSASCQAYFYCDGQNAAGHEGKCPNGFLFNPRNQICDHPYNVDCTVCSPFGVQHIENPSSCHTYIRCSNGQRSIITCPTSLSFDQQIGECNVGKICYSDLCQEFYGFVKIGDPNDCTVYISCLNGQAFRQSCAPGLYYNAHSGQCELPGSWNYCQGEGPLIVADEYDLDNPTPAPTTTTKAPATNATTTRAPTVAATTVAGATTTRAPTTTTRAPTTVAGATTTRAPTTATTRAPTTATTRATTTKPA